MLNKYGMFLNNVMRVGDQWWSGFYINKIKVLVKGFCFISLEYIFYQDVCLVMYNIFSVLVLFYFKIKM